MDVTVVAAIVSAFVAAVTTLFLDIRRDRRADRRAEIDSRANRLAEFLGSTHQAVVLIGILAKTPSPNKAAFRQGMEYMENESREATALNAIQLLDPEGVVNACIRLHRMLVHLHHSALAKEWSDAAWAPMQSAINSWVDDVLDAGHEAIGHSPLDRQKMWDAADREILERHSEGPRAANSHS